MTNNQFLPVVYMQGAFVPFEEAKISVATHALHYGTAAFGGLRAEPDRLEPGNVTLFRPDLHFKRLADSARLLGYGLSEREISDVIERFIASNPADKPYYLRPLVYASDLGVAPRLHDVEFDFLVYGINMGEYLSKDGIRCCFSSWTRGEDRSLPLRGKISGSYVTSALAKTEAIGRGYDEAIFLNSRGKVAEASAMNIFMVRSGVLITPDLSSDILEGITRRSIIELARDRGITVRERQIDKSELLLADEVFLTGTAARVAPVSKIEQYDLPKDNPITQDLMEKMGKIARQESAEYEHWLQTYPGTTRD